MRQIPDEQLWIGNALDARNPRALYEASIEAVVDLAYEESPAVLPRDLIYCRFPLLDGEGNQPRLLRLAMDTIARLLESETSTLVSCSGGMSRSVAVAAGSLARFRNEPADQVIRKIAEAGPHDVSLPLWKDVNGLLD